MPLPPLNADVSGLVYQYLDLKSIAALEATAKMLARDKNLKLAKLLAFAKLLQQRIVQARDVVRDLNRAGVTASDKLREDAKKAAEAYKGALVNVGLVVKAVPDEDRTDARIAKALSEIEEAKDELAKKHSEIRAKLQSLPPSLQAARMANNARAASGGGRTGGPIGGGTLKR